jgi:4-hydroxy-4-methyl-2-oxoglutarate aldolase
VNEPLTSTTEEGSKQPDGWPETRSVTRQEASTFDQLAAELYTAVISDILDSLGHRDQAMTADIRPVYPGARLVGRAHTILSSDVYSFPSEPYEMEILAIDSVPADHVVVAGTNKSTRTCLWGELLSTAARARGGRGAVIDGHTRDVAMIEQMNFPVFSTGMRPVDSLGRGRIVSYGEPGSCGGVVVHEGDIVFADVDGVVVIPRDIEDDVIARARHKVSGENQMREWLRQGRTLREAYDHFGIL